MPAADPTPTVPVETAEPMGKTELAELRAALKAVERALAHAGQAHVAPELLRQLERVQGVFADRIASAERADKAAQTAKQLEQETIRRQEEQKRLAQQQLDAANAKAAEDKAASEKPKCGYPKPDGTPCQSHPLKGKERCRRHDGKPLPQAAAEKPTSKPAPASKPAADKPQASLLAVPQAQSPLATVSTDELIAELARRFGIKAADVQAAFELARG
jgi:hypothetical protein